MRDLGALAHTDERPQGRGGDEVEGEQQREQRLVADRGRQRADQQREQRAAGRQPESGTRRRFIS